MKENEKAALDRPSTFELAVLFLPALLVRITGLITFENNDENWGAAVRVLIGNLSGGTSQTLPLINYLDAASFVVMYVIGRIIGLWHTTADFRAQYFSDRTPFVFAGRFVTAAVGAFSAPIAAMIASRLGLARKAALLVGGMVAILPINVWLSHFAKPDSGVATGVLLFVWALLYKLDNPRANRSDVLIGVSLAIVMSYKQTCLFVIGPAFLGFVGLLIWECKLPFSEVVRGLFVELLACVIFWAPMNIGVLLDISAFLDFQRAQVIVLTRHGTPYQIAAHVIPLMAETVRGFTSAAMLAWLFAPLVRREPRFLVLWVSTVFAFVAFSAVSGGLYILARYLLPFHELAFTLGCAAAVSLAARPGPSRLVGGLVTLAIGVSAVLGTIEVVRQVMTPPMSVRCSEVLRAIAQPGRDKILASSLFQVGVPIDPAASDEEHARHERLAKKYGVSLPERVEEKKSRKSPTTQGYFVRQIPAPFGGMEELDKKVAETAIKPFWWPIQEEEYNLDYWTSRGFNIFVVKDEAQMLGSKVPEFRSFYKQIKERCEQVAVLPSRRTLFWEAEVRVYRFPARDRQEPPAE